jgi:1-acyl-sn-glycerol-3-phosphate acyltransferase
MTALRSILVFAWIVISIVPFGTGLIITGPFLDPTRSWWWFANPWLRGVIGAARWIGGVDYRVTGLEHLPGPDDMRRVILVSKHQSTWETFFFPSMTSHPLSYVLKKELLRIPVFGWCVYFLDMICIDRRKRNQAWSLVASRGAQVMDRGKWVIMFPEGTRGVRGGKGVYKSGASRLALATNAELIPIAVSSGRCWPRRSFRFIPGRIDVSIGPPIAPDGRSAEDLMQEVESWIETEMRRIDPEAYPQETAAAEHSPHDSQHDSRQGGD